MMIKFNLLKKTILPVLLSSLLVSCEMFNKPVKEYLQYYTETAAIGRFVLNGVYPKTDNGITCLTSDSSKEILLYLRNPQNYADLILTYKFADTNVQAIADSIPEAVTINKLESNSSYGLTFSKEFLETLDGSEHNSLKGTLSIRQDSTQRQFESFEINYIANTAPVLIRNPMFQLTNNGSGDYVVCFFVPFLSGTIHRDIDRIIINNVTYYMSEDRQTFYTNPEKSIASDLFQTSATVYPLAEGGYKFSDYSTPDGYIPIYYYTNQEMTNETVSYEITLKDKIGLASSTSISNKAELLNSVIIKDAAGNPLTNNSPLSGREIFETATVLLDHDGKTENGNPVTNVLVNYSILKGEQIIDSGTKHLPCTIEVPYGRGYTISATAQKSFYLDSDETSVSGINVKHSSNYYVSNTGNDSNPGSLEKPLSTIQKCIETIKTEITNNGLIESGYTINVLNDLERTENTDPETPFINIDYYENFTLTIRGTDAANNPVNRTLDAKGTESDPHQVIVYSGGTGTFTFNLENLTLTGGYTKTMGGGGLYLSQSQGRVINATLKNVTVTNNIINNSNKFGAGVYTTRPITIQGKTIIQDNKKTSDNIHFNDSNLYLAKDTEAPGEQAYINCTSKPENGSKIHFTTETQPAPGQPVKVITNYYGSIPFDPNTFVNDDGYAITKNGSSQDAYLTIIGGNLTAKTYDNIKISINKNKIKKSDNFEDYSITLTVKDGETSLTNGSDSKFQDFFISVSQNGYGISNGNYTGYGLTINTKSGLNGQNPKPFGLYQLTASFIYNSKKYQAVFDVEYYENYPRLAYQSEAPRSGSYSVSTFAELQQIKNWIEDNKLPTGLALYLEDDITVDADFSLGASVANKFTGTIDGKGHTISGLKKPLIRFGTGTIRNLTVEGDITGNAAFVDNYSSGSYVGGNLTISNCINKAKVTSTGDAAGAFVAFAANGLNITISKCINYGDISCTSTNTLTGGLAGKTSATINNCINYGTINSNNYTGGIAGQYAKITNCINYGTVSGKKAGGIIGLNRIDTASCAELYNCVNLGKVEGQNNSGQIIGENWVLSGSENKGTYKYCYYLSGKDSSGNDLKGVGITNGTGTQKPEWTTYAFTPTVSGDTFSYKISSAITPRKSGSTESDDLIYLLNNYSTTYNNWSILENSLPKLPALNIN